MGYYYFAILFLMVLCCWLKGYSFLRFMLVGSLCLISFIVYSVLEIRLYLRKFAYKFGIFCIDIQLKYFEWRVKLLERREEKRNDLA